MEEIAASAEANISRSVFLVCQILAMCFHRRRKFKSVSCTESVSFFSRIFSHLLAVKKIPIRKPTLFQHMGEHSSLPTKQLNKLKVSSLTTKFRLLKSVLQMEIVTMKYLPMPPFLSGQIFRRYREEKFASASEGR